MPSYGYVFRDLNRLMFKKRLLDTCGEEVFDYPYDEVLMFDRIISYHNSEEYYKAKR